MVLTPEELDLPCAKQGDRLAFDRVFERYKARVTGWCARLLKGKEDEEQAVVDTMLAAWKALPEFREECPFELWLYRIAIHTCYNLLRTKKSRENAQAVRIDAPETGSAFQLHDPHVDVAEEGTRTIFRRQILLEIEKQAHVHKPPWDALDRAVFELYFGREMSLTDIAAKLEKPISTIDYRHKHRIMPVIEAVRLKLHAE